MINFNIIEYFLSVILLQDYKHEKKGNNNII